MTTRILAWLLLLMAVPLSAAEPRPNILWLVNEDHGTHVGCYGDPFATTPTMDGLAARGLRYSFCWSNAPVCAPARTTLITGLYGPSVGGEHMRSMVPLPRGHRLYPQLMRELGYYCTNNAKEDYNVEKPDGTWDESSRKAHWMNRPDRTPFFAVFNSEKSHESKLRIRPHVPIHNPAGVRVPAYHPDTPEVRQDWAQYYDCVTAADADAGLRLRELQEAGLAEDTIVFYFSDHGSGMPRNKRWPYHSGLHVPLIVYIPEKFRDLRPADYQAGGVSERLVSFVDFAPTLLSLAGARPPDWMQGHAFLGRHIAPPPQYLFGFRGRMDEREDLVRSVTDGRYVYLRQYMPHLIYGQRINYMFQTPTTRIWKQMHDARQLTPEQDQFWNPKPAEELYDLQADRDEVRNLAGSAEHSEILSRLRAAHREHVLRIRDLGFLPEGERFRRAGKESQYDMARDPGRYPLERILDAADAASRLASPAPDWAALASDADTGVRYWAAIGLRIRGQESVQAQRDLLRRLLADRSAEVAIAASQALISGGDTEDMELATQLLIARADWSRNDVFVSMAALNGLESLPNWPTDVRAAVASFGANGDGPHARYKEYVPRLLESLNSRR